MSAMLSVWSASSSQPCTWLGYFHSVVMSQSSITLSPSGSHSWFV